MAAEARPPTRGGADVFFTLNGSEVSVSDGISLLDVLREELGCRSVKDGCSPQGQCGCCTVWVDDLPRVACVTPVRRVAGRHVTTLEGAPMVLRDRWSSAFVAAGASQCGFCTPGIVMRLAALDGRRAGTPPTRRDVEAALRAPVPLHRMAVHRGGRVGRAGRRRPVPPPVPDGATRFATWRSEVEGRSMQGTGPDVVLGGGGFADDSAPAGALVQLGADAALAPGVRAPGGRRTCPGPQQHDATVPSGGRAGGRLGDHAADHLDRARLRGAGRQLEPARWPARRAAGQRRRIRREGAQPRAGASSGTRGRDRSGGPRPVAPRGRGAPGAEAAAAGTRAARRRHRHRARRPHRGFGGPGSHGGRACATCAPVCVSRRSRWPARRWRPNCAVPRGRKCSPPCTCGTRRPALWARVRPTSRYRVRGVRASTSFSGTARAGRVEVDVWAGEVLCPVTLRSYALGAVHQALGMVWSEGIAVDGAGEPVDLTIRSFGILAARDMPEVTVRLHDEERWPVNGSDAVFVATLAAAWIAEGKPARWPTRRAAARAPWRDVAASAGREERA